MFFKEPDCTNCVIMFCSQILRHPYLRFLAGKKVKVVGETETKIGSAYIFEIPENVRISEEVLFPEGGDKRYYQVLKRFTQILKNID